MTTPVVTLFSNNAGVGTTSLVYHLSWMFSELGKHVLVVDLDPQAGLTSTFIDEDSLDLLLNTQEAASTIYTCLQPVLEGTGSIFSPTLIEINDYLSLLAGDLSLSKYELEFARAWPNGSDWNEHAFQVTTAFWQLMRKGAEQIAADIILVDIGPNLGAINRAALVATDYVVIPLTPNPWARKGLETLGDSLRTWRTAWGRCRAQAEAQQPELSSEMPDGGMNPLGYIVWQHPLRLDRPVSAYEKWLVRIPQTYHDEVIADGCIPPGIDSDPQCLALMKHFLSVLSLAREARKPIFDLKPAEGALGSYMDAVLSVRRNFDALAREIAQRVGLQL
jgi:cellulose biosynthesis protein BcsQ